MLWGLPGSFLALKDALVIACLENDGLLVVGERAMLMPIGPSMGCPDGLYISEFLMALVT